MTDKIIKMAHRNTEYDLGVSQEENFQEIKVNVKDYNNVEANVYLQKFNDNWVSISLQVINVEIKTTDHTVKNKDILKQFIPKSSYNFRCEIEGTSFNFSVYNDGTINLYFTNSKISFKYGRSLIVFYYKLN